MKDRIRLLGLYLVAGVWVLAACSGNVVNTASASTDDSAALSSQGVGNGGVLACTGVNTITSTTSGAYNFLNSTLQLTNFNGLGSISVDRIVIYNTDGTTHCDVGSVTKLGPHQNYLLFLRPSGTPCPTPLPPTNSIADVYSILVYWSYEKPSSPKELAFRNPLDGFTVQAASELGTNIVRGRSQRDCKEIKAAPFVPGFTCTDACNRVGTCMGGYGQPFDQALCLSECNAIGCTNKQGAINCLSSLVCPPDANSFSIAANACLTSNGCPLIP